jgi:hypothetical protein
LLPSDHQLDAVEYFTARVRSHLPSVHRQADYLSALEAQLPDKVVLADGTVLERPAYWRQ